MADLKRISELIYERHNYDFRNYAISSFRRRVVRILELKKLSVNCLLEALSDTPRFVHEFVRELTVNVTEMYRDPRFWSVMRCQVLPALIARNKVLRVWHAGCSSGEEVVAMCILLKEMGVLESAFIAATDLDDTVLERAQLATFPMKDMPANEKNYAEAGGPANLERYYTRRNSAAVFDPELIRNVTFSQHDLVLGDVFDTFDLILCRNVMIYFNQHLQNEVLTKFHKSLNMDGYLAIGSKESLIWSDYGNRFAAVNSEEKVYLKVKE